MPSSEAETTEAASTYDQADMDVETKHTGPPGAPKQKSWLALHFSLLLRRDRQAQKAGQLFSGLLALNVVFLGGAFICSMIFNKVAVTLGDVWILLAALKVLSLLWLLYYTVGTTRKPHAVLYRDPHAGPVWVRGECSVLGGWWRGPGKEDPPTSSCLSPPSPPLSRPGSLVLFGSCTVCLNVFRMGYDVSHIHCKSEVELIFPAIEIVFMIIQVMGLSHPPIPPGTHTPPNLY